MHSIDKETVRNECRSTIWHALYSFHCSVRSCIDNCYIIIKQLVGDYGVITVCWIDIRRDVLNTPGTRHKYNKYPHQNRTGQGHHSTVLGVRNVNANCCVYIKRYKERQKETVQYSFAEFLKSAIIIVSVVVWSTKLALLLKVYQPHYQC